MELTIKRGDIYYAELNPVIGSEQGGTRPVLIISNDIGNKHSPTVIIAPNLIDLYMSNLINKDEFTATRASCDAEIEELQSIIESVDKQREMIEQQQQLLKEIEDAIKEIVSGVEYEDEFYKHILDKMVVQDKDNIDVYLNLLPMKWSYTVAKASKKAVASEWNISEASLPMSVSRAFSSG